MIEKVLLEYLEDNLDVPVVYEAPAQITSYVLIDKTGSSRRNTIVTSTFAIQSYGASLLEAAELSKTVEGVMDSFWREDGITRVELDTDYNFTNTATKQYRWQAVYRITHYQEV